MISLALFTKHRSAVAPSAVLVVGFVAAVGLRVALGGLGVAQSAPAGLVFAAALIALSAAHGIRLGLGWQEVVIGAFGGAVICLPAMAARLAGGQIHRSAGSFLVWAAIVTVVAAAEELFLRGALFDALNEMGGQRVAIGVGAVAFAGLHVPLYGWHVIPLDFAVGVWLGVLRTATRSWITPAIAHVTADLAGWWLR